MALCALAFTFWLPTAAFPAECEASWYELADGSGVDIAPVEEGHYRWRRLDGTSGLLTKLPSGKWSSTLGWTERSDGKTVDLAACASGVIGFDGQSGRRVDLATTKVDFSSAGVQLAGRLVMPPGKGPVPVVVLVHGSEDSSALQRYALQRLLPAQGIGAFVYDKRGTGQSQGVFTHDLHVLAADAEAALRAARSQAGERVSRIGFYGTSQGGWTAPLAAAASRPDFVIVGYGLAVSPIAEDNEALALDMTRHGFGPAEIENALKIGAAAQSIVRHEFAAGYDELRRVADKYRGEPWFRHVRGNVTGILLKMPEAELRALGPKLFRDVQPDYDPMPVLRKLPTPQLWILGKEDIDAPYLETRRRLSSLRQAGAPISIVTYPDAEHGLYLFETKGEERLSTQQPPSLQRLLADFARGEPLATRYDDAEVIR